MRDIIFRGKRLDNGEWVYGHYSDFNCNPDGLTKMKYYIGVPIGGCEYEVTPSTIGQYTGMKDRAGKMIWEDDIMLIPETDFNAEIIGRVIYEEDAYYIIPLHGGHLWGLCWSLRKHNAKIIGNIHDHPDLLK